MFHFFSSKRFLVDYLEGFVDMHNHVLPGIDDGAKTVDESLELIKGFSEFGVTNFIATPHIMNNYYPNTPETIDRSLNLTKNALLHQKIKDVTIRAAAEHMIDDNFERILEKGEVLSLGYNFLLIEMSFLQPSINFKEALEKIASNNFFAILAHPERYTFLHKHPKKYSTYKSQGIQFQLNLLSLGDFYGKETRKIASKLLDEGLIDYIGSDVHNLNQLEALKTLTISKRTLKNLLPVINNTIGTFY